MAQTNNTSANQKRYEELSVDELKALINRLTFIQRIGAEFASTLPLNELLDKVIEEIIQVLQAEVGSIWLSDSVRKEIVCYIATGPTKGKIQNFRLKEGQGIVGSVALTKTPKLISDVRKDPNFTQDVDKTSGFVTRSMVCAPILAKGESLGSIEVINKVDSNALFHEDDLELLSIISTSAGVAIKNAQLYASERKAKELSAILEISKEITSTLDLQQVLFTVVNLTSHVIEFDRCAIALENKGVFELSAVSGTEELDKSLYPNLSSILTWSGNTGREVWINDRDTFLKGKDTPDEFQEYFKIEEMQAVLLIPLKDEEGILGVFCLEGKVPYFIPDTKFQMLQILVNQTTVAIRNAQLYSNVPMGNILDKLRKKKKVLTKKSKLKSSIRLGIGFAFILLLLIPFPYFVAGNATVNPVIRTIIYSRTSGTVQSVPLNIREGKLVKTNEILALIDDTEYRLQKINLTAQLHMLKRSLPRLQSSMAIADFKQNQLKLEQVRADLELVDFQLANCKILSTVSGIILTPDIEEKVGSFLSPGTPFSEISDLQKVRVDINVTEDKLGSITIGKKVKLKVKAYPLHTYEGEVTAIAQEPIKVDDKTIYLVRAVIPNDVKSENKLEFTLKPGMTGRAKILAPDRSLGYRLFGGIIRAIRLKLWI